MVETAKNVITKGFNSPKIQTATSYRIVKLLNNHTRFNKYVEKVVESVERLFIIQLTTKK